MSIAKMKLMEIEFPLERKEEVLNKLMTCSNFHPVDANKFVDSVHGLTVLNLDHHYDRLFDNLQKLKDEYHCEFTETSAKEILIQEATLKVNSIIEQIEEIERVMNELKIMVAENEDGIVHLNHMINSDLNFDRIFACKYLKVRFGSMPINEVDKLKYYDNYPFMYHTFHVEGKTAYGMYMATTKVIREIDNIFTSLNFDRIKIPTFVHGTPEKALAELNEENSRVNDYLIELESRITKLVDENKEDLNDIYAYLKKSANLTEVQKYVVVFGQKAAVFGFVESKEAKKFKADFEMIQDVLVEIKPATSDPRLTPPTKLKQSWFVKPFSMFVEMYGVPSYKDFDPTVFVALSYTLLFGIMFGDVGQGAVLSLVGFIAYKLKGMKLGAVGMRLGLSSMIFGVLFGSIFGSEEIIHPIFAPMESENVMTLLIGAISVGVALIIISIICNTIMHFKKHLIGEALFSHNGISGLVFYSAVLLMAVNMMVGSLPFVGTTLYNVLFIAVPVLLIFLKEPLIHKMEGKAMFPNGFGGFFTESFFELFEVVLTFIANTMSFLRVGGFVLSHAGMMLVVYTIAGMFSGVGSIITLVLGNAFVMCLEGLIVGIQVLRLEFYEMFSRYYEGKGEPFVAITDR